MKRLTDDEIAQRLERVSGWQRSGNEIRKSFDRGDFMGSVAFVNEIAGPAEEMGHHPDLSISWSQVGVAISTHSAGGLTESDFELAARIDSIA